MHHDDLTPDELGDCDEPNHAGLGLLLSITCQSIERLTFPYLSESSISMWVGWTSTPTRFRPSPHPERSRLLSYVLSRSRIDIIKPDLPTSLTH